MGTDNGCERIDIDRETYQRLRMAKKDDERFDEAIDRLLDFEMSVGGHGSE